MAFVRKDFNPGSGTGKAPSIHSYTTPDTQATVNTAGYFDGISKMVKVGDLIYAYTDNDGTPAGFLFVVNANASGVVDVTDGLAIGTADAD